MAELALAGDPSARKLFRVRAHALTKLRDLDVGPARVDKYHVKRSGLVGHDLRRCADIAQGGFPLRQKSPPDCDISRRMSSVLHVPAVSKAPEPGMRFVVLRRHEC